jgi:hypothetical protein
LSSRYLVAAVGPLREDLSTVRNGSPAPCLAVTAGFSPDAAVMAAGSRE